MEHIRAYAEHVDAQGQPDPWTDWCEVEMAKAVQMQKEIVPVYSESWDGEQFIGAELGKIKGLDSIKNWSTVNAMKVDEKDVKDGVKTIVHLLHQKRMEDGQRVPVAGKVDQATIAAAQRKYQGKKAPLCASLEAKDEDAAEALLDGGADPNEVDGDGYNALHRAAEKGCRPPLLQRVLARIHDVNACDNNGRTALMHAARENHLDVVISLLNHPGIDVNVQNRWDATALHCAAYYNHPAIVSQLLSDDNINANLKDRYNNTPLKDAIYMKHPECVKILQDYGAQEPSDDDY